MAATAGKNMTLWVGAVPTKVACSGVNSGVSIGTFDTTCLGDDWESVGAALKKGDDVKVAGIYNPADAGQIALFAAFGSTIACEIHYTAGATPKDTFTGLVTGFSRSPDLNGGVKFDVSIKPSGAVTTA